MKVSEIMNSKVMSTTPLATTKEAARQMHDIHVGCLTVMDGDQLVGILTDRDICCKVTAKGRDAGWTKVHEIMTREVTTCFADQTIEEATDIMMKAHIRRLAVVDRNNKINGFLSVDDLARASHQLASHVLESSTTYH
ncbi:MAG: CBS domain-containing protein [Gammaproteobacteria bacterium]|nr:CBS domain-containing protein [Gammaproteobacteria bacterium]MDH5735525.1 CBS domain-containing protein [Gammaproteobacteria bacterium]